MKKFKLGFNGAVLLGFFLINSVSLAAPPAIINPSFFYTSPPNPVGSGARAMGVGGAFIAVADDATAANWNPGALIQLELPEASVVGDYSLGDIAGQTVQLYNINYLSASYPFTVKNINMILAINYQRLLDFNLDFDKTVNTSILSDSSSTFLLKGTGNPADVNQFNVVSVSGLNLDEQTKVKMNTVGSLGAVSPAFAIQITPKFSLGVTANLWRDGWIRGEKYSSGSSETVEGIQSQSNALWYDSDGDCTCNGGPCSPGDFVDNPACLDSLIPPSKVGGGVNPTYSNGHPYERIDRFSTRMKMEGESYNFGLLWDMTPRWTMGAVYRTGATLDVAREVRVFQVQTSAYPSLNHPPFQAEFNFDEHVYLPSSYGLGAGFRYSDALTISADLSVIRWDEYFYKLNDGTKYSLITGLKEGTDDVAATLTGRVGAEYLIIKPKYVVPIRGGFFYDQEPAIPNSDGYYGITAGTGFAYKWMVTDIAYIYRFGRDVHVGYAANDTRTDLLKDFIGNVDEHQVMLSVILHMP